MLRAGGFAATLLLSTSNTLLSAALAKKGMRFRGDPSTSIFVIEVIKFLAALVWHAATRPASSERPTLRFVLSSIRYGVPALLYLVMNNVIVFMVATFGGLNTVLLLNLKIPATGILTWLIMGRRISLLQFVALCVLCVGTTLSQLPDDFSGTGFKMVGLMYGLFYAFMSALSGVSTEMLLRGGADESLALQQVQLYFWGVIANALLIYYRQGPGPLSWVHPLVVSMIASQVLTGVFTAWLLRTQGQYARVFLHSLVGICVGVFEFIVFGDPIRRNQIAALFVISFSIYAFKRFEPPVQRIEKDYLYNLDDAQATEKSK